MNEYTVLLLSYLLMCFTDYVPESETRSEIGIYYMVIGLGNLSIHLFIMILTSCRYLVLYIRKRLVAKK